MFLRFGQSREVLDHRRLREVGADNRPPLRECLGLAKAHGVVFQGGPANHQQIAFGRFNAFADLVALEPFGMRDDGVHAMDDGGFEFGLTAGPDLNISEFMNHVGESPELGSTFLIGGAHQDFIDVHMRGLAGTEHNGAGDVCALQLAHAVGPVVERRLRGRVGDMVAQLGLRHARLDHGDADIVFEDLAPQRFAKTHHAPFRGRIAPAVGVGLPPGGGGHVENVPVLPGAHTGQGGLATGHEREQVQLDHVLPAGHVRTVDGLQVHDPGVVDQDVEAAEMRFGILHDGLRGFDFGQVGRKNKHLGAQCAQACGQSVQPVAAACAQGQARASLREQFGGRFAEAG